LEVLSGIKIVKSLGWEPQLKESVDKMRAEEVTEIGNFQYLIVNIQLLWSLSPTLISVSSFALYTILGHELTAAKAFTALSLFDILTGPVQQDQISDPKLNPNPNINPLTLVPLTGSYGCNGTH